jgi:glycosyltransferase involved in cell wall biosynthesis
MAPLTVLYIVPPTGKFAGIERVVDEIACGLALCHADALDVTVVHLAPYPGVEVTDRPYRSVQEHVSGKRDLLGTIRRVVAARPYDLVVVPQVEPAVICWLASLGLGRRFVVHLHGNPAIERGPWKARILFGLMQTLARGAFVGVFGTSPRQLEAFQTMMGLGVPHIWAPNPVRRFDVPPSARSEDGTVRFVNVGRYSDQKGQDILIDAFARLLLRRPHARLTLVGYGESEPLLRERAAAQGLAGVVDFAHLPDNPQAALAASDVYVSTSRWEGWGLTICEALRLGLPVLATDCDFGPSDILTDPRLGRLVPPGDMDLLVEGLVGYCDRIAEERLHAAYRQTSIARYDLEVVTRAHAEALVAIAGHR